MKAALLTVTTAAFVLGAVYADTEKPSSIRMPWREAGLTGQEAAAHLLNRFAFGPRPGEVDTVVKIGLERWFELQLADDLPDEEMEARLHRLPALDMSTAEIFKTYPPPGLVLHEAKEAGILSEDVKRKDLKDKDRDALKSKVMAFAQEKGYRPQKELLEQLMVQKLVRAVESENQLSEVMTDFWFNHFNVSSTDNKARAFLLSYERDAIRPYALGRFRDLLEATAKNPAMLVYLDNAQSSAAPEAPITLSRRRPRGIADTEPARRVRPRGVNENYARELMELHTLGVNGGYTQQDVVEVARAFTGWTLMPLGKAREMAERRLARVERVRRLDLEPGFQRKRDFLFRADQHDAGEKTVLGTRLPAGRGIEDGEAVLDLLAAHKATARHLASKLAVRFVSDNPPPALVDRLADVYLKTGGDIRRLLVALVESPEFWSRDAVGAKIKSPFELAASALRAGGGEIGDPREILNWIARMGQPLYAYQAPSGYPDRAETWVNNGSLLNRMSFGLQLAAGRVRGIDLDWAALNGGREPESREEALRLYAGLLMPGRDLASTLKLLGPMVADPNLAKKVDQAAPKETAKGTKGDPEEEMVYSGGSELGTRSIKIRDRLEDVPKEPIDRKPPTPLEQVVGVILGSPEFQRR